MSTPLRSVLTIAVFATLTACGSDPIYMADSVKFDVDFELSSVRVQFRMNPNYSLPIQVDEIFEDESQTLGTVRSLWDENLERSILEAKLNAFPPNILADWPTVFFQKFPNGKKLPEPIRNLSMKAWFREDLELQPGFIYDSEASLNFGGALLSTDFNFLPSKFFATQLFTNRIDHVTASVTALGPGGDRPAGLYFFAHLGSNPFESEFFQESGSISFEVHASEEVRIEASRWDLFRLYSSFDKNWDRLKKKYKSQP